MPGFNSIGFVTFLKKLEKWKSRFVGQLERFELVPRGQGQVLKSGSIYIYISQLWTDYFSTKNLIIILHMLGATMFIISICFYCGTRKFCRENRHHWLKPVLVLWHCFCDRTSQNQVNQEYNLPPEQYQQQPGYSQSAALPHRAQSGSSIEMQDMTAPIRPQRRLQAITYQPQTYCDENSGYSGLTIR